MQLKQYLKITLSNGSPFNSSPEGFPQLECKGPFPFIIWEERTTNFWFVDEKGAATYTPNFWTHPSDCSSWISSRQWIAEPINPRFTHSDHEVTEDWNGYLELIDEQLWHIYYNPDRDPVLCGAVSLEDLERFVNSGIWKQIPPIQTSPTTQPKSKHIPARKPTLEDIFHTL